MADEAQITLKGVGRLRLNLGKLVAQAPIVTGLALKREGDRIMNESQRLVPVDTGALKGSGMVEDPVLRGNTVLVLLHYGSGPSADYALKQHEDTTLRHTEGQQAKFLEQPFREAATTSAARIAADVEALLILAGA